MKDCTRAFFLLSVLVCALVGRPLYGGGSGDPSLTVIDHPFLLEINPLTDTDLDYKEEVLFEVRISNTSESTLSGYLWFTVNLTGVEHEKMVKPPYTDQQTPIKGSVPGNGEVILRASAWPLEGTPTGPYTFFAKAGRIVLHNDEIVVDAMSTFSGVIEGGPTRNQTPDSPEDDSWEISSIWAVNEAGRVFLAGSDRSLSNPRSVNIIQNYPNPFNPSTSIAYEVKPVDVIIAPVKLAIYNIHGQLVRTLINGRQPAGIYTVKWDGRDDRGMAVNSGMYFFKLQSGKDVSLRKGVLTK